MSRHSPRPESKRRRLMRTLLIAIPVAVVFTVSCNTVATRMVNREDKQVPRNADGVMIGAEARELGNPSSQNAALFVHGFAGAGTNFKRLPEEFAKAGWYVRVMRLPGHGTSPYDLEKTTAGELENAVVFAASELKAKHARVVLVGHSMGGALSTIAAAKVNIDGLILGGAYFGVTYRWYYVMPPEVWTRLSSHFIRWVYKGKLFTQINDESQLPHILSYTWLPTKGSVTLHEIGVRANDLDVLAGVRCPVLMFHSHGDVAASPKAAQRAFRFMRNESNEIVWVDRSNHHVFWDYDCDLILEQSTAFIKSIDGREPITNEQTLPSSFLYDKIVPKLPTIRAAPDRDDEHGVPLPDVKVPGQ
ncbi:MAG: alpha/beta fold hydrolase [Candidatus Hydrogenedentes bacterium]|nr:alpha/beta fold hydrolase [Candidatus Hydrogenedentota bacterium]